MQPAVLVRLRPLGPWRNGSGHTAAAESQDSLFRSDRLYSALTLAFADLGFLEEWLDSTARSDQPAVRVGSLFPYQGDTLFAIPPRTLWPPPPGFVTSPSPIFLSKLRWAQARFVPVTLVQSLANGQPALADQWVVDGESRCLLRRDRPSISPFRHTLRRRAAVDRLHGASTEAGSYACVEFEPNSGLWTALTFADTQAEGRWRERVEGAFRLLADSGFGGGRRVGWGQVAAPRFEVGAWPGILLPKLKVSGSGQHWLFSLFSPSLADKIDWTEGDYRLTIRRSAGVKTARFAEEGSVISSSSPPVGQAVNVTTDGAMHAVYRSGFALAIELPEIVAEPVATQADSSEPEIPVEGDNIAPNQVEDAEPGE